MAALMAIAFPVFMGVLTGIEAHSQPIGIGVAAFWWVVFFVL